MAFFGGLKKVRHAKVGAGGKRPDCGTEAQQAKGGLYLRSKMEANLYRYFRWLKERGEIDDFGYEGHEYRFPVKRGTMYYTPDFWIRDNGKFYHIEAKGYMDAKSRTQLKRMKLYHPSVPVAVIDYAAYRKMATVLSALVPNWEF